MKNPLRKITALFILISLLPTGFIVYELASLNKNETIVREIYRNQLDAILYSVNQYTDDVISSWANRFGIEMSLSKTGEGDSVSAERMVSLLRQTNAVPYIYFTDLHNRSRIYSGAPDRETYKYDWQTMLDELVARNEGKVERLIAYHRAGFKKMEPVDTTLSGDYLPVFFVINADIDNFSLGVMVIDLPVFITQILSPKMQAISQEEFIISAFREGSDSVVYTTGGPEEIPLTGASYRLSSGDDQEKDFWLLPGYALGISLKGATIDDLVNDRITTSLVILVMLLIVLATGLVFLYRNIRREIALSQAKSEFVSNVSHEIRTPLSLISMYAETLEMDRVSEQKKKEYYSVIAKETERLSGIVNRILDFSHLEANKKKYDNRLIGLNDLCGEVLSSYSLHLENKGFTCDFIKAQEQDMIYGDKASIAEAIINLLDNAIKYSREIKHIVLKTGCEQKFCFVEVTDQGIGIAKNHQPEIFDQFYRAPISDVHDTKGSGLGLTLVKKTVEAHHGKIKVESALGKGSTFRLYFPAKSGTPS